MKTFKLLTLAIFAFFVSCSSDDSAPTSNELQGLSLLREMENDSHVLELYTKTGTLQQGYNAISVRIKDKTTGQYQTDANISWTPLMHMTSMQHSCPFSAVAKTPGKETLYNGYIVFQMAENASEYWTISIDYSIDGSDYSVNGEISVPASAKRRVASFAGSDGNNYIVAMADPDQPAVGLNQMTAVVYKTASMMSYSQVENFTVKIDPRMPGMGNHGSPNNIDLTQNAGFYSGTLSLTMTGYWKINLQVLNPEGEILKGEAVTEDNPASSIFFEVEF